jgi:hypothetical protein
MTSNTRLPLVDEDARLANRATLLTMVSVASFLVALMAVPLTLQRTDRVVPRIAASVPLAVGAASGLLARGARGRLHGLRARSGPHGDGPVDAKPGTTNGQASVDRAS